MPVVDEISKDYADQVDFVAVAWKGSFGDTAARATELLTSGNFKWGLDADQAIFQAYGIPYQPVTVLISSDRVILDGWAGVADEATIREKLDQLASS